MAGCNQLTVQQKGVSFQSNQLWEVPLSGHWNTEMALHEHVWCHAHDVWIYSQFDWSKLARRLAVAYDIDFVSCFLPVVLDGCFLALYIEIEHHIMADVNPVVHKETESVNTEAISPAANLLTSSIASPNVTTVAVTSVVDVTSVTAIVTPILQSAAINQQGKSYY